MRDRVAEIESKSTADFIAEKQEQQQQVQQVQKEKKEKKFVCDSGSPSIERKAEADEALLPSAPHNSPELGFDFTTVTDNNKTLASTRRGGITDDGEVDVPAQTAGFGPKRELAHA